MNGFFRPRLVFAVVLLLVLALPSTLAAQGNNATIRPIEDFVSTQGSYCSGTSCELVVPPIPNFIGWSAPAQQWSASIDYAGLANSALNLGLGTSFDGKVTERPLADGRAEVEVVLKTHNALTWVIEGFDYAGGTLLFGHRGAEVATGSTPGLCDSFLHVKLINTAPGAPLPDLVRFLVGGALPGQELLFLALRCNADGPLRAAFGVPDGTAGKANVAQTGLLMTPFRGAVADGFPVERIHLHPVGK